MLIFHRIKKVNICKKKFTIYTCMCIWCLWRNSIKAFMKKTILIYRLIDWKDKMLSSSNSSCPIGKSFWCQTLLFATEKVVLMKLSYDILNNVFKNQKCFFNFRVKLINSYLTIIRLPQNKLKIIKFLNFHFPRRVF